MTVLKIFYVEAKKNLAALSVAYKEAQQNKSRRLNFENLKQYLTVIEKLFMITLHVDLLFYRKKLKYSIRKHASMIDDVLKKLLEENVLNRHSYDLLVHLSNLNVDSFSRKQSRHIWHLIHEINKLKYLEEIMAGNMSSEKLLKEFSNYYGIYCKAVREKWKFIPEAQKAYKLAISVLKNEEELENDGSAKMVT